MPIDPCNPEEGIIITPPIYNGGGGGAIFLSQEEIEALTYNDFLDYLNAGKTVIYKDYYDDGDSGYSYAMYMFDRIQYARGMSPNYTIEFGGSSYVFGSNEPDSPLVLQ